MLAEVASQATRVHSSLGPVWWVLFLAAFLALLLADLLLIHRKAHVVGTREAAVWSSIWIALGVAFAGILWLIHPDGSVAGQEYLSGYIIEKSLSVDNLFVFVLIFQYFGVPDRYQHRVLFWGILGALVLRGLFIALGAVLLNRFEWIAYIFGAFLLYTGVKLATSEGIQVHPEENPVLRFLRRFVRMTEDLQGQALFVRRQGRLWATPLLAVLIVIESTDVVFAVDSIPAIFGVTRDPFLVFSSNAFALLGLRALYFLLASAVRRFRHLDMGVAVVLALVGVKFIVEQAVPDVHLEAWQSLTVISLVIGTAIIASVVSERRRPAAETPEETVGDRRGE